MRTAFGIGFGLGLVLSAACVQHTAAPPDSAATPPPPPAHWTAKVCTSVKDEITLHAGPSRDDTDIFGRWRTGDGQVSYGLPQRIQQLSQVFVRAATTPEDKMAQICVMYDGRPKKALNFSGRDEDHLIKSSDTDDTSCRCQ